MTSPVRDPGASTHAWAKVNLALHVTGRRPDGYHLLESLVVFPAVGDKIQIIPSDRITLEISGPFAAALEGPAGDNLAIKAARAFLDTSRSGASGVKITLEKNLPVASGIGGGSADAAAVLRLLAAHYPNTVDEQTLLRLALSLGADVPVCLASRPAIMTGIGEDLASAPGLPAAGLVLINPGQSVSTPSVFKALKSVENPPLPALPAQFDTLTDLVSYMRGARNDLEAAASDLCPGVTQVLQALNRDPDIAIARMSGSGATCFGLCETRALDAVTARLTAAHPDWWIAGGALNVN